jgi:predicted DNA-binding antitoxin AbrB/MazE fold protein
VRATVEAIFEDGVFKPVERPEIPEGEHVQLTVETAERAGGEDPLELAVRVYRGLRPEQIDEIERIAIGRSDSRMSGRP